MRNGDNLILNFSDVVAFLVALQQDHNENDNISADYTTSEIVLGLDKAGWFNREKIQECLFSALEQDRKGKFKHPVGRKLDYVIKKLEKDNNVTVDREFSLIERNV